MLRAGRWIASSVIDLCATHFAQRSVNPVILARSDHYDNLLQPGADIHQHPTLNLTYFGIPDSVINLEHEIVVPIHLPGHWTMVIIQPMLQRFIYYDGLGGDPASVVPVISDWLAHLYASKGLTPTTPVNSWPISCPTDAPKQRDSYNCGPNSLLFLYMWLTHRRFPSLLDWNVGRAGADQEATRLFLCYHLLTQGGQDITPRWHTAPLSLEPPTIPSRVLERIRQSMTRVSHTSTLRASNALRPRHHNTTSITLPADRTQTLSTEQAPSKASHAVFDVG